MYLINVWWLLFTIYVCLCVCLFNSFCYIVKIIIDIKMFKHYVNPLCLLWHALCLYIWIGWSCATTNHLRNCHADIKYWNKYLLFIFHCNHHSCGTRIVELYVICVKFASCTTSVKVKAKLPYTCHKGIWRSGSIAPHIPNLRSKWSWVVSFMLISLYPQLQPPPLNMRLAAPRCWCWYFGEEKNFLPVAEIALKFISHTAHCTVTIPAHSLLFLIVFK